MQYINALFRAPVADDLNFIYNSWLKGFRDRSAWAAKIPSQVYFSNHKKILAAILQSAEVIVAVNPEYPDQIFGYAVYHATASSVTVLHYVYVKQPYRKVGLGSTLVQIVSSHSGHDVQVPMVATHYLDFGWNSLSEKWNVIFNPYVLQSELFYDQTKFLKAS